MAQVVLEPLLKQICGISGQVPSSPSGRLTSRFVAIKLYGSMMVTVVIVVVDWIMAIDGRWRWRLVAVLHGPVIGVRCLIRWSATDTSVAMIAITIVSVARIRMIGSAITGIAVAVISRSVIRRRGCAATERLMVRCRRKHAVRIPIGVSAPSVDLVSRIWRDWWRT